MIKLGKYQVTWKRAILFALAYITVGFLWGLLQLFGEQGPFLVPDWHDPADWWWVMRTSVPLWPLEIVWFTFPSAILVAPALIPFLVVGLWLRHRRRAAAKRAAADAEGANL